MPDQARDEPPPRIHRTRVLKGGTILLGIDRSSISCTVRNMNEGGAELRVPADTAVPPSFLLYVAHDGLCFRCEQRWRRGERMGVEFTGTEPRPRWHIAGG